MTQSEPTSSLQPERLPPLTRAFWMRILPWMRPYFWQIAGVLLLVLLSAGFQVIQPLILRNLVDQAVNRPDLLHLALAAGLLVLLPVLTALLGVAQRRLSSRTSTGMTYDLRVSLYRHLQQLPYRMYVHAPPGEITARMSGDVAQTSGLVTRVLPDGLMYFLRLLGSLAAMLMLDWRLTLAGLLVMPLVAWFARRRNYRARQLALEAMQANAAMGLQTGETLGPSGVINVRLFDRNEFEHARFRDLASELRQVEFRQDWVGAEGIIISSLLAALGTAIVYAVGGLMVAANTFTIGTVIAFVSYLGGVYSQVQGVFSLPQAAAMSLVAYGRIFELLDLPAEETRTAQLPANLPQRARGKLEFKNVSFKFIDDVPFSNSARPWSLALMGRARHAQEESIPTGEALSDISFSVEPGQMVALVGPSGAGKSTLFNLIPRFHNADAGTITLDDQDIQTLPLAWLRRQIGFVSQSLHLIHGTLGDNLRYANPAATDADLDQACRAASLTEFIASLPDGYDTYIGASGSRLSGGEAQRLALARALLKDCPILLLDEPTSHLDSINEAALHEALIKARQGRATLVIAHRLSTVRSADVILVLDHGRIVERGSHLELLNLGGLYTRLYEKQFAAQN